MADLDKIKVGDTTYNIKDSGALHDKPSYNFSEINSRGEAHLDWGGRNISSGFAPIDAAMVGNLGANRTAFIKPGGVTIEYSRDAGTTWTDYGASNSDKIKLFTTSSTFYIGKSSSSNKATKDCMLRVTVKPYSAGVYTAINKYIIFVSTNGSTGCYCTIRGRLQSNVESQTDTWATFSNKIGIGGWSGYNVLNPSSHTWYGNSNSKGSQYGEIQFIFGCTGHNASYDGLQIFSIYCYGGVGWSEPSNLAKTGLIYSFDHEQNVTFPAKVKATNFENSDGTGVLFKSGGTMTGGITFSNDSSAWNDKGILFSNGSRIGESGSLGIYSAADIYYRTSSGTAASSYGMKQTNTDLSPTANKGLSLGTSSLYWNNIYGTNIYQNGTKVSVTGHKHTKSDITDFPTIPPEVTESTVSGWGFTKNTGTYSKPSGGIPKTDLASAVQTSLGKADTALQSHQDISGKTDKSTLTTKGDIYYASAANTPARLGIGSSGQVLTVSNGVPAWATPSGGSATHLYKHVWTVNTSTMSSDYYAHDIIIISTSNSTTDYAAVIRGAINLYQGKVVFIFEDWSGGGDYYLFGVDSYSASTGDILCRYFDNYNGVLVFDEYNPFNTMAITVSDVVTQIA